MKSILLTVLTIVTFSCWCEEANEIEVVQNWLNTIDRGEYKESWSESDPYFQSQISQSKWHQALSSVRKPLGELVTRELIESNTHESLPGVPDGQYLVSVFKTQYENKNSAKETVTFSKSTGQWKAVGYFIN